MSLDSLYEKFHKDGYAIIEDFLGENEIAALKDQCQLMVNDMNPAEHSTIFSTTDMSKTTNDYFMTSGDKIRYFFEDGVLDAKGNLTVDKNLSINKIGHALHALDPVFKRVTFSDKVKNVAKALRLVDPVVIQSMYIFKQPGIGGEVVPHQDSTFLFTDPLNLVGLWIALEDATEENGCLWFIPGSHKNGLYGNRQMIRTPDGSNTVYIGTKPQYEDASFIPGPVKKGSLVLIHGEVVHKSEKNTSPQSRHIYTFHIYDQSSSSYSSENWLQPTATLPFPRLFGDAAS